MSRIASDLRFAIRITNCNRNQIARFGALSCSGSTDETHLLRGMQASCWTICGMLTKGVPQVPTNSVNSEDNLRFMYKSVTYSILSSGGGGVKTGLCEQKVVEICASRKGRNLTKTTTHPLTNSLLRCLCLKGEDSLYKQFPNCLCKWFFYLGWWFWGLGSPSGLATGGLDFLIWTCNGQIIGQS